MKKIYIINFLLVISLSLEAKKYNLYWNFKTNTIFTVNKFSVQIVKKNGRIIRENEVREYAEILPVKFDEKKYLLKGKYYSFIKPIKKETSFQLSDFFSLDFYMDRQGKYFVKKNVTVPTIRNIPVFPDYPVEPGDMWEAEGIEIFEFKPPVTIPVDVNYHFVSVEKKFDRMTAKIVYDYFMNHILDRIYRDIPYKYLGGFHTTLWYNLEENLPLYLENIYDILFIYPDGTSIEYTGNLKAYYNIKPIYKIREDTAKIENQITEEAPEIKTKRTNDKVIIYLGEIYFKFNSAELTEEAKRTLKKIGKVLKKYKDASIFVKGYTDSTGDYNYNLKLSEERAKNVVEYLIKKGYIKKENSSYKGYGEENPVADNSTEEGRRKNRRVEIIIKP